MTVVLDTNVLSELRLPRPNTNVWAWLATVPEHELALASFSLAEIERGITIVAASRPDLAAQLSEWLDNILATHRVLPLAADGARILGRLLAVPALRNLATTPPHARAPRFGGDLVIASIAVAHNAAVATRNVRDFRLIARHCPGLTGIDPWTGQTF